MKGSRERLRETPPWRCHSQRGRKETGNVFGDDVEIWNLDGHVGFEMSEPCRRQCPPTDGSEAPRRAGPRVFGGSTEPLLPPADPYTRPGNQLVPAPCQSRPVRCLHDSQSIPRCTR